MPELHNYGPAEPSENVLADFTATPVSPLDISQAVLGIAASIAGHMCDPVTFISSAIVGLFVQSFKQAVLLGGSIGLLLACLLFIMNVGLYQEHLFIDGWFSQVLASLLLSSGVYSTKWGCQYLRRIQHEMDDCEAYMAEIKNPHLVNKPEGRRQFEPVKPRIRLNIQRKQDNKSASLNTKEQKLNLIQKTIVSIMIPVMVLIGLKAISSSLYYNTEGQESWWIWIGGLGTITWFEVWFWRDRV